MFFFQLFMCHISNFFHNWPSLLILNLSYFSYSLTFSCLLTDFKFTNKNTKTIFISNLMKITILKMIYFKNKYFFFSARFKNVIYTYFRQFHQQEDDILLLSYLERQSVRPILHSSITAKIFHYMTQICHGGMEQLSLLYSILVPNFQKYVLTFVSFTNVGTFILSCLIGSNF